MVADSQNGLPSSRDGQMDFREIQSWWHEGSSSRIRLINSDELPIPSRKRRKECQPNGKPQIQSRMAIQSMLLITLTNDFNYFPRRSKKRAGTDVSENESLGGEDSDVDMGEDQPKMRRQRTSDGSEGGTKPRLSRAERLNARTLAKV